MNRPKQIRLGGFGGQGVVLAGHLLGLAAVAADWWVAGANVYGARARGGIALAEVVIAAKPIKFPRVILPDIFIAFSQQAYDRYHRELAADGRLYYDRRLVVPAALAVDQVGIPATDLAVDECGRQQAANLVMLGAVAAASGLVEREYLARAVRDHLPAPLREVNLRALEIGGRYGEQHGR
ncbi:MAG: 2-oxoacid:acceptor oxidoreductase family protein [Deltaproteobacteria bacterium]|nr:2-oxoacid:acceptor oxidoreductase family protein [Deltaproteobacteria bacterium]